MATCLIFTSLLAVFSTVNAQNIGGSRGRHHAPGNRVVLTSRGEASLSEQEVEADKNPGWENDNTHTFIQNVNGSTPTGWMQLGTPPKWLFVIFDTGSDKLVAKTWDTVANELASVDQGIDGMVVPSALLYNHNGSSTYVRKFMLNPKTNQSEPEKKEIAYGSGAAITDEGNETVSLGIFKLPNFSLSEITSDSLELLHTKKGISGVLGLQHMMNRSLGRSIFSRMRDEGKFTAFSYCRGTGNNGTFLWGDTSTEGHEIEVLGQMHWAVALGVMKVPANESAGKGSLAHTNHTTGIKHHADSGTVVTRDQDSLIDSRQPSDGSSAPEAEDYDEQNDESEDETALPCAGNKCVGILDSGSNILAGPKNVMQALSKKINMAQDCSNFDQLPTITLIFGGQNVSISPEGYTMKVPMPDWAKIGGGGSSFDGQGHGDGSGELLDQQGKRQKSGLGWKAVFEHLKKNRGIDLSATMRDTPDVDVDKQPEFMCMPALVPLDKLTSHKKWPLYIIGTPLLQTHYARWSHKAGTDEKPKIFIKKLSDTQVCKDAKPTEHRPSSVSLEAVAPVNAPLIRSEQRHLSQAPLSGAKGPFIRHIDDISFPHWAHNVDTL